MEGLTPAELTRFLDATSGREELDARTRALAVLLASTGISLAEALALRHSDVRLTIGRVEISGPRARRLHLPHDVVVELLAWEEARGSLMLAADRPWFCSRSGSTLDASQVRRQFGARTRAARIDRPVNARALRDTFVARQVTAGIPADELARQLGHTSDSHARRRVQNVRMSLAASRTGHPPLEIWEALLTSAQCGLASAVPERDETGETRDLRLEFINPFGAALLGIAPDGSTGLLLGQRFPQTWTRSVLAEWVSALQQGTVDESAVRHATDTGQTRIVMVKRIPLAGRLLISFVERRTQPKPGARQPA